MIHSRRNPNDHGVPGIDGRPIYDLGEQGDIVWVNSVTDWAVLGRDIHRSSRRCRSGGWGGCGGLTKKNQEIIGKHKDW
jgi:hypothetical protein